MTSSLPYNRILLKLSGEMLMGDSPFGISLSACHVVAQALQNLQNEQVQVAIVIGGGNIFRGISLENGGMQRTAADQIGMLATVMNGICLHQALNKIGAKSKVMSAVECPKIVEPYHWEKALHYLN